MKVLMLCGVFADENQAEVVRHARAAVEYSANVFQQKLIAGFKALNVDFQVVSAPFVGAFPNASDLVAFRGFQDPQALCEYVPFNNIWGLRNFSRANALKKAVRKFAADPDGEKLILIYCTHTPFLEAAVYAKKLDPRIKLCLYVPDLPQYMNLSANRSKLYDVAKQYDIAAMTRLMKQVDSFVLLTRQMKDCLPVGQKPCRIIEGIVTEQELQTTAIQKEADGLVRVVYTGKLNEKFGVKTLVDAFCMIQDPAYRLVLCGRGDCEGYIMEKAKQDPRILYQGQVTAQEAKSWMARADVLVNPRKNDEEYTKYSFPSKNVEYLLTGNSVVGYLLDGMPPVYREFMTMVPDNSPESLAQAMTAAAFADQHNFSFRRYAREQLEARGIAESVMEISGLVRRVAR